ncbi:MAG: response regulator [Spirulina sp. SIO3F2]|nr:response regulator [Spirulina sp. SIO3F2]
MTTSPHSGELLILVIEDEFQVLENTVEILELGGYRVATASNGYNGLEAVRREQPDLIICDVMMPKMDGYAVLETLRADPQLSLIPFIFLTAKADRTAQRQGMALGADDYLTKPFTPKELLATVETRFARQATVNAQINQAHAMIQELKQTSRQAQGNLERSEQLAQLKEGLLDQLLTQLCNPVSSINLAISMLDNAQTEEARDRYLKVLKEECQREMQLLKEVEELRALLTPEKTAILQRFKLLQS